MLGLDDSKKASKWRYVAVVVVMFGFGYLMVPIYDIFCEVTGINGKTGVISENEIARSYQVDTDRNIKVQFMSVNNSSMPWTLEPMVKSMAVNPGQIYAVAYKATNKTSRDMVGQAVPSVAPNTASLYFNKTECFCFTQQDLAAGESKEMPLRFVIDPALPDDISTVTLAYTIFDVTDQKIN
ncbi:MAG: cytochrome c oxidase assembly protein [Gammaproteobacteria bacterium]|jgi:cytochrome c oxidase assembly protein subunit 11